MGERPVTSGVGPIHPPPPHLGMHTWFRSNQFVITGHPRAKAERRMSERMNACALD